MILPSGQYGAAYREILSRARGSPACTTYLFVAPDVDGLCAARLLSQLLKTDDVAHQTIPVGSWMQLAQEAEQLRDEDVRNLILINLGASADLYALFGPGDEATGQAGLDFPPSCMIHVVDSHRPVALANLFTRSDYARAVFDPRRVRALQAGGGGGGFGAARVAPLPEEELSVVVWDEVREKATEVDDLDSEARARIEDPWKREREAWEELEPYPPSDSEDSEDSEEDEPEEEDDDNEDSQGVRRKRRRTDSPKPLSREQRRAYRAQLAKYEAKGASFSQSVAGMMYLLAEGLGRADIDSVWLAILGLTHQLTNSLIDLSSYESLQSLYATEVARLSSSSASLETANVSTTHASTSERDRSIRPSDELRFCLFRHWNLYDAMYHSGYLGGRMKLWTVEGRKKLSGLLAKMGLSLSESSETYAHMSSDLKASLFPMLSEQRAAYALWDLTYPSFVRKSGWRVDLSASDCVEALAAMLEAATGVRLDFSTAVDGRRALVGGEEAGGRGGGGGGQHDAATQHGGREEWAEGIRGWLARGADGAEGNKENRRPGQAAGDEDEGMTEKEKRDRRDQDESEARRRNFWHAWDALDPEDTTLLRRALPLSMALHRAVISQGSFLFDKQGVRLFRSYRLAILKEGPDLLVFQHPATLLRLAHWLVDSIRSILEHTAGGGGANAKNLPLVVAALNEKSDKFLVVGVVPADEFGDVRRNRFGRAFEEAAIRSRAKAQQRYFDASVVEVRKDDFDKFLKDLSMA
ncbi:DNA replication initiation factor CDC45 [Rhodotorula paludigena]|uniref:DNA replication initiation factor CDC45 n=1 Tax=Rhodotorula paludigena TaxID=86838 RepID=UPI00317AB614